MSMRSCKREQWVSLWGWKGRFLWVVYRFCLGLVISGYDHTPQFSKSFYSESCPCYLTVLPFLPWACVACFSWEIVTHSDFSQYGCLFLYAIEKFNFKRSLLILFFCCPHSKLYIPEWNLLKISSKFWHFSFIFLQDVVSYLCVCGGKKHSRSHPWFPAFVCLKIKRVQAWPERISVHPRAPHSHHLCYHMAWEGDQFPA